jgi:hypothetical protein
MEKIIKEITDKIKKIAHLPVQTLKGRILMICLEDGSLQ